MSNQIDNKLFLYNAEGRVIGVKKGSEEAIQATKKEYRKEQGTERLG